MPSCAPQDVHLGSKADIAAHSSDVRFTPKSRHGNSTARCPLYLRKQTLRGFRIRPGSAMAQSNPKVVILGAGFGGLEATKALGRAPLKITLIDRQNYHCFQPLLYQVATAALSPADVAWPIRHVLRQQKNATVLMTEVNGIDPVARIVSTEAGAFSFDFLVIATGARNSYFGHHHWADVAPGLKRIEDATRIR